MNYCDLQFNLSYKEAYMNLVCICQNLCFPNLICSMEDVSNELLFSPPHHVLWRKLGVSYCFSLSILFA